MTSALQQTAAIPADDPARALTIARPDTDKSLVHVAVVGDTYTMVVTGKNTAGRYALIDMHIPPGGGPPPHRHDFEEMFTILDGEVEFSFRGEPMVARSGETVNIPANAPHSFRNVGDNPARLLCMCSPSGQEEFFLEIGNRVSNRTAPAPEMSEAEQREWQQRAAALAPKYRTELLPPPS